MREGVLRVLDSISAPAYVRNNRMDVLAANRLGRALFADVYAEGATGFNLARYLFLDPRSRDFYTQWDVVARDAVAALRIEAGRNPYDRGLTGLVGAVRARPRVLRHKLGPAESASALTWGVRGQWRGVRQICR